MKTKNIFKTALVSLTVATGLVACDIEPDFYSQVVPDTFYSSQEAVWQRFSRPFTHWRWYAAHNDNLWRLQELGTDEFMLPTRGSDWFNGGVYQKFHHHEYTEDMTCIYEGWRLSQMGTALAWDALEDLQGVDFDKLDFEEGTRESMLSQLQALVSYFYLKGLDLFGGMPLYTTTQSDVKPRSTDVETFNFIDSLLTEAIPNLPVKKELEAPETGSIHAAAAAAMKAQLYFNAKSYIKKEMWNECAQICQDIIDGKYGQYALDPDWTNIFGFTNETCPEILWSVPSENAKLETDGTHWSDMVPYNYRSYLGGLENSGSNNAVGLMPSLDPTGKPYTSKLGRVYSKFNDKDIRKQNYVYLGNGKYKGMFIVGELINPVNPEWKCLGSREYKGKVINEVDQVAYFTRVRNEQYKNADGSYMYNSTSDLPSTIATAEENSGIRVTKVSPRPIQEDVKLMYNPDVPVIRLAEIYYMLAECKMRTGDKAGAAELINTVRKRYFEDGVDPDPVTAGNLDKYRMLDEWQIEFVAEARRRTDLIRWDAYVNEDWWDHTATHNEDLNRFPIHYSILNSNQLLEQNPGYGR
jgi:hypothetical protein